MEPKKVIEDLIASGKSEAWIAAEVNRIGGGQVVTQPTINRIKRGRSSNPSYRLVSLLLRVHETACREAAGVQPCAVTQEHDGEAA